MTSWLATFGRTARESGLLWACALVVDRLTPFPARGLWRPRVVAPDGLAAQLSAIFRAWGMPADQVAIVVEKTMYADLRGIDSHGCAMLATYDRARAAGRLAVNPPVTIVRETAATALVDGGGGLGHVPATVGMTRAIEKCRHGGVGVVAVRRSGHFGAAGAYAAMAASEGFIGLVTTSTPTPAIVPTFGLDARLGTNPIAIAAPAANRRPFLLDMATSTVSLGALFERRYRGQSIPTGWALDDRGAPATGATAIRHRRLTPLGGDRETGGHKGYGLAVAVEILSRVMPGVAAEAAGVARTEVGHFLLAIDPAMFRPDGQFGRELDDLIDSLHESPPREPGRPVLVAGDPEAMVLEQRTRDGIPLSRTVFEDLRKVARGAGVPFSLEATRG